MLPEPSAESNSQKYAIDSVSLNASEFAQKLKKKIEAPSPRVKKEKIQYYHIYDKHIPGYGVAVDAYGQQFKFKNTILQRTSICLVQKDVF